MFSWTCAAPLDVGREWAFGAGMGNLAFSAMLAGVLGLLLSTVLVVGGTVYDGTKGTLARNERFVRFVSWLTVGSFAICAATWGWFAVTDALRP